METLFGTSNQVERGKFKITVPIESVEPGSTYPHAEFINFYDGDNKKLADNLFGIAVIRFIKNLFGDREAEGKVVIVYNPEDLEES